MTNEFFAGRIIESEMQDYNYYLFDADGTLIDTTELIWRCFENTARTTGHEPIGRETTMTRIVRFIWSIRCQFTVSI